MIGPEECDLMDNDGNGIIDDDCPPIPDGVEVHDLGESIVAIPAPEPVFTKWPSLRSIMAGRKARMA